LRFSQ